MSTPNDDPDMTLIAELLEDIQRHPPAVAAKTLLAQHYLSIGWYEAASDYVEELKREVPNDTEVTFLDEVLQAKRGEVRNCEDGIDGCGELMTARAFRKVSVPIRANTEHPSKHLES